MVNQKKNNIHFIKNFIFYTCSMFLINGCHLFYNNGLNGNSHYTKKYFFNAKYSVVVTQIKNNLEAFHIIGSWDETKDGSKCISVFSMNNNMNIIVKQENHSEYTQVIYKILKQENKSVVIEPVIRETKINFDIIITSYLEDYLVNASFFNNKVTKKHQNTTLIDSQVPSKIVEVIAFSIGEAIASEIGIYEKLSTECEYAEEICDQATKVNNDWNMEKKDCKLSIMERIQLEAKAEALSENCYEATIKCNDSKK